MEIKNEVPGRILIIDDDAITSNMFAQMFARNDFKAQTASQPANALNLLQTNDFDLVLLDIFMPEINGVDLLKEIRKIPRLAMIPIIMITSSNDGNDLAASFEHGANDFLTKPINMHAALARIKAQINSKRLYDLKIKVQELNTIRSMTVTYHHEINNPLAIAQGLLQLIEKTG